ncbi:M20 family metallopeptidase [Sporosarcina sp. FSL K6-1508]|uniref:M20 family metallopeptidase n=1 Tax=Sporosarcina sp. FSL K6-1508 TaxID=2921553 RepID=UPI0030FA5C6F
MTINIKQVEMEQRCEKILSTLVKINSTHPKGNEMDMIKAILSFFENDSILYKVIDHGVNRASLVITIPGENSSTSVAFIGHVDTVPVGHIDEWTHPPFEAFRNGDFMFGRGTADMKGGITAMILTILYLLEHEVTPRQDLHFCFTADEESDGMGILSLKEAGYFTNTREIIIPEPTNEKVGIAEKGALWLEVSAKGIPAHGSRPELGVNAIEKLMEFINLLRIEIDTAYDHPLLGKATISVNEFEGGVKTNIIPAHAKMSLDIRTLPTEKNEEIISKSKKIAQYLMTEYEKLHIDIEIKNNRPAIQTEHTNEFVMKVKRICDEVSGELDFKGLYFYTDASQVVPDLNVPFVILGPGDDEMAHQLNEKIALSSIRRITEIYIRYILEVA